MKNNLNKIIIMSLIIIFCSCIEQKYIFKGNVVATAKMYATAPLRTDSLFVYKINKGFKSKIENKGNFLIIKEVALSDHNLCKSIKLEGVPSGEKKDLTNKIFFPNDNPVCRKSLIFFDTNPVLQGLSIPIKIRPKLDGNEFLDSFPSQTETGFNPAIAAGWKLNLNFYNSAKDIFGNNSRQVSITPGLFFGTGATNLKKSNTRNPIIEFERKATLLSTGAFIVFGFNNLNIGYSFGKDWATGEGSEGWLYQGEIWHGITIGLDIIK